MSETSLNVSRRKFILVSSAAVATPFILNMADLVPDAKGTEKQYIPSAPDVWVAITVSLNVPHLPSSR